MSDFMINTSIITPEQAVLRLVKGNEEYINSKNNNAGVSKSLREDDKGGQKPFAVILTCSDSSVPVEYIFSAGIGELFVVMTAGNVVNDFELGTVEFGIKQLGAKVVVVMGHRQCGAVAAALEGNAEGYIADIVDEIRSGIGKEKKAEKAENLNIINSYNKILKSTIVTEMLRAKEIDVLQAKYDTQTGKVEFLN
jgi:carbonic anhydrase